MGYDMHWIAPDPDEAEIVKQLRSEMWAAVEARDSIKDHSSESFCSAQTAVDAAFEEREKAERSYFRLNGWGMSRAVDLMDNAGMLCRTREPEQPEWSVATLPGDIYCDDVLYEPDAYSAATIERAHQAQRALDALLERHEPADAPGIPVHKFGSNDGWRVLPIEIQAALRAYQEWRKDHQDVELPSWWGGWLEYLRGAIDHGGFRVC